MRSLALPAALCLFTALLAATGCSAPTEGSGAICSSTGSCGTGLCVVGRCRPAASSPAPLDAKRIILAPSDLSVLTSADSGGDIRSVPEAVAMGRKGASTVVLFRFAAPLREGAEITSAFLVLDPISNDGGSAATSAAAPPYSPTEIGASVGRRPVSVDVARILDPWDSATASWGRQPRLSLPEKAAPLKPRTGAPARIDVTAFVREWPSRKPDDHGIALLLDGDDALGSMYSMGISDGAGPRLEVYVR